MGALSVTANAHYREPFGPLIPGVTFVRRTIQGLEAAVTERPRRSSPSRSRAKAACGRCRRSSPPPSRASEATGTLLIADEIQCGLGRTGRPFHFQSFGWTPDLITVGKAIGSGIPIGAALVAEHVAKEIFAGDHGTTYGGNLLSTRAALYVLEQLDALAPHIREIGALFEQKLIALQKQHKVIGAVRGAGLDARARASVDAAPVVEAALKAGLLVNRTAERVVRMLPPLTVTAAEIDEATGILDGVFRSVSVEEVKA